MVQYLQFFQLQPPSESSPLAFLVVQAILKQSLQMYFFSSIFLFLCLCLWRGHFDTQLPLPLLLLLSNFRKKIYIYQVLPNFFINWITVGSISKNDNFMNRPTCVEFLMLSDTCQQFFFRKCGPIAFCIALKPLSSDSFNWVFSYEFDDSPCHFYCLLKDSTENIPHCWKTKLQDYYIFSLANLH